MALRARHCLPHAFQPYERSQQLCHFRSGGRTMDWLLVKTKRHPKSGLVLRLNGYLDGALAGGASPAVRKFLRTVLASRDNGWFRWPGDVACPEAPETGSSLPAGAIQHQSMNSSCTTDAAGCAVDPSPHVSFVLPCYNEGAVLPELYRRVREVADALGKPAEIVFVND